MLGLLAKIIPLDLAATLSPGIFALTMVLLGGKNHPKLRTLALLFGTALVGAGIALLGYSLGQVAPLGLKQNSTTAFVDLALGAFFVFFGLRIYFSSERKIKVGEERPQILKWIVIGIIISATNFDALFLSFAAAKEVGGSEITGIVNLILLIINLLFFTLPITLPLFLVLILPRFANTVLQKINHFVLKYSRYIISALFIVFGIYFLYRAITFLI